MFFLHFIVKVVHRFRNIFPPYGFCFPLVTVVIVVAAVAAAGKILPANENENNFHRRGRRAVFVFSGRARAFRRNKNGKTIFFFCSFGKRSPIILSRGK